MRERKNSTIKDVPNSDNTRNGTSGNGTNRNRQTENEGRKEQSLIESCGYGKSGQWWSVEPNVGRLAHGIPNRVDRLKGIGNGQVPLCMATAYALLTQDDNQQGVLL